MTQTTKRPSPSLDAQADGVVRAYAFDMGEEASRFERLWEQNKLERIVSNVATISKAALSIGAVLIRIKGDTSSAISWYRRACEFTPWIKRAVDREPGTPLIEGSSFECPITTCLLAHSLPLAKDIGVTLRSQPPSVRMAPKDAGYTWATMISACVLDDKEWFKNQERKFNSLKKPYMYELYSRYVPLMNAVLARDGKQTNTHLQDCESSYFKRRKDRKLIDTDMVDGGMEENDLSIDYVATAISILAVDRGIEVAIESDVIPKHLIYYGKRY